MNVYIHNDRYEFRLLQKSWIMLHWSLIHGDWILGSVYHEVNNNGDPFRSNPNSTFSD